MSVPQSQVPPAGGGNPGWGNPGGGIPGGGPGWGGPGGGPPGRGNGAGDMLRRRLSLPVWGLASIILVACLCGGLAGVTSHSGGGSSGTGTSGESGGGPVVSQATNTPAKPRATATPTATPKPKQWVVTEHWSGTANTQTPNFELPDGARIVWSASAADQYGGDFGVEMYTSDGTYADLVANTSTPPSQSGVYNAHGDQQVYLKVDTYGCDYEIKVEVYK